MPAISSARFRRAGTAAASAVAVPPDSVVRRAVARLCEIERAPVRVATLLCKFSVASLAPLSRCKSSRARDDMLRCKSAAAAASASCASIARLPDGVTGGVPEGVSEGAPEAVPEGVLENAPADRIVPDLPDSIARFSRCKSARMSPAV